MPDIFDKLVGGINKGVASVGANSKAMLEKAKINSQIAGVEKDRRQLAELLGMKVYENHIAGGDTNEGIDNFIQQIGNCVVQIDAFKLQLKQIDDELKLSTGERNPLCKCGSMNAQGAKFCAGCGSPLEPAADAPTDGVKCGCGHVNVPEARFCAGCGSALQG